ncbi:MAG: HAMP domain-containing histidine kinase [Desulfobulbaceae bacterium]|nr:HAMP domain-containing histidine kinase [Desulfobulbaceae bacterium]
MFKNVLHTETLGIIIIDFISQKVMFKNRHAVALCRERVNLDDYQAMKDFFCPGLSCEEKVPSCETFISRRIGKRVVGFSVRRESKRYVWIIMRDITRERRLESIAEAVNVVSNIGYIFSGIRHEIGNPLNTIKMTVSVLLERIGEFPLDKIKDYLNRALGEIDRIEYLLRLLKNYNYYEKPDLESIDVYKFLKKFIFIAESDLKRKGISLVLEQEDKGICACADPRALHQVLLNLVANGVDALEMVPDPLMRITVEGEKERVFITVSDNGQGMNKEQLRSLFQPFVTHKAKGTGLGLVFSRKILIKMGGTIEAYSREGIGTSMVITLPVFCELVDNDLKAIGEVE